MIDLRMCILRVAQKAYPGVKGGEAYHVYVMSCDQAAMGYDVTVLTLQTDSDQPRLKERNGDTVVRSTLRSIGRWTLNMADVVVCDNSEDEKWLQPFGVSASVE